VVDLDRVQNSISLTPEAKPRAKDRPSISWHYRGHQYHQPRGGKAAYAAQAVLEGYAGRECARLHDPSWCAGSGTRWQG
jgi:hypothetical protein